MDDSQRSSSSGRVSEIEVEVRDPTVPCVAATTELGGRLYLEQFLPRGDGSYAEYYGIEGIDPDRLLEHARDHEESDAQLLCREGDEGLLEMVVTGDCPAKALADRGAVPRSVSAARGVLYIVAEVPPQYDEGVVTGEFLEEYPDAELVGSREKSNFAPLVAETRLDRSFRSRLTDRQQRVIELAEKRGYYEWPREVTAAGLAEELGLDSATVDRDLQAAERKLVEVVFDGTPGRSTADAVRQA